MLSLITTVSITPFQLLLQVVSLALSSLTGSLTLSCCIGIPVKFHPEDVIPGVQYAALIADLVMKTKQTLK